MITYFHGKLPRLNNLDYYICEEFLAKNWKLWQISSYDITSVDSFPKGNMLPPSCDNLSLHWRALNQIEADRMFYYPYKFKNKSFDHILSKNLINYITPIKNPVYLVTNLLFFEDFQESRKVLTDLECKCTAPPVYALGGKSCCKRSWHELNDLVPLFLSHCTTGCLPDKIMLFF